MIKMEDWPQRDIGGGCIQVSGPGGSPFVVDPERPHLGGNFDGGDLGTMYQNDLWPWLVETFGVKTMADVGCGTGETLRWFSSKGVASIGVEGLPWNVARCRERGPQHVFLQDFCEGPLIFQGFDLDLIWCADVAEHVPEEHSGNLIQTISQCQVLAMCQGTEENENQGWGHVNNKPEQYWVDKLAAAGMIEDVEMTKKSREVGNHGWWQCTGRIYRKV